MNISSVTQKMTLACGLILASSALGMPSIEEVMHRLPAVHATDGFPQGGVIRLSGVQNRLTLHFALGGLVPAHMKDWGKSRYAIIEPFEAIAPRVANFFAQDTAILGNHSMSNRAFILVPAQELATARLSLAGKVKAQQIVPYKSGELKAAIDRTIAENNFFSVEMSGGVAGEKAMMGAIDINSDRNFSAMIRSRLPLVSFTAAMNHPLHAMQDQYSRLASVAFASEDTLPLTQLMNAVRVMKSWIDSVKKWLSDSGNGRATVPEVYETIEDLVAYTEIFQIECDFRAKHGWSLGELHHVPLNPNTAFAYLNQRGSLAYPMYPGQTISFAMEMMSVRSNPRLLQTLLVQAESAVKNAPPNAHKAVEDYDFYPHLVALQSFLPLEDFEGLLGMLDEPHSTSGQVTSGSLFVLYGMNRVLMQNISDQEANELISAMDGTLNGLAAKELALIQDISKRKFNVTALLQGGENFSDTVRKTFNQLLSHRTFADLFRPSICLQLLEKSLEIAR